MKVAIHIKTDDWNRIIDGLKADGWKPESQYDGFDAGIDFDFLVLKKGAERMRFGWDNWFEGEIQCSDERFEALSRKFGIAFEYGAPNSLKPEVIAMAYKPNLLQRLGRLFIRK